MKLDAARPVHLKDYRPPAYLIDRVNLDVSLEPTRTRVRSKLTIRPNPKATGRREQLKLDGEQLELGDIVLDGRPLGKKDYKLTDTSLTLTKTPTEPFTLEITTFVNPEANKALQGIYRSNNVYCSAVRGAGLPPHHLLPRPARRARHLHGAHRGRPARGADPARQRQPAGAGHAGRRQAALRGLARPASQALLPVRPRRRRPRPDQLHASAPCRGATSISPSMSSTARKSAPPGPWTR